MYTLGENYRTMNEFKVEGSGQIYLSQFKIYLKSIIKFIFIPFNKYTFLYLIVIKETKFPVTSTTTDRVGGILANVIKLQ